MGCGRKGSSTHLQDLVPRIAGGQPEQRQHGGTKGQEVGVWVLLTQLVASSAEEVHAQNGVDEKHEEQQAAYIEHRWQGTDQGIEQCPQAPADHVKVLHAPVTGSGKTDASGFRQCVEADRMMMTGFWYDNATEQVAIPEGPTK